MEEKKVDSGGPVHPGEERCRSGMHAGITRRNQLIDNLIVGLMSADTILSGLDSENLTVPSANRIAFTIKNAISIADLTIEASKGGN